MYPSVTGFLSVWDIPLPFSQLREVSELKRVKTIWGENFGLKKFGVKVCKKMRGFAEMGQRCTYSSTLSPAWPQERGREQAGNATSLARNHQEKA